MAIPVSLQRFQRSRAQPASDVGLSQAAKGGSGLVGRGCSPWGTFRPIRLTALFERQGWPGGGAAGQSRSDQARIRAPGMGIPVFAAAKMPRLRTRFENANRKLSRGCGFINSVTITTTHRHDDDNNFRIADLVHQAVTHIPQFDFVAILRTAQLRSRHPRILQPLS